MPNQLLARIDVDRWDADDKWSQLTKVMVAMDEALGVDAQEVVKAGSTGPARTMYEVWKRRSMGISMFSKPAERENRFVFATKSPQVPVRTGNQGGALQSHALTEVELSEKDEKSLTPGGMIMESCEERVMNGKKVKIAPMIKYNFPAKPSTKVCCPARCRASPLSPDSAPRSAGPHVSCLPTRRAAKSSP